MDEKLLSYGSATGYMPAIKLSLIVKFRFVSAVPKQLSYDIWKQYTSQIFGINWKMCVDVNIKQCKAQRNHVMQETGLELWLCVFGIEPWTTQN